MRPRFAPSCSPGVTVGIGLGVLLLVPRAVRAVVGLAGILIPVVTIAAALTLLPALMAMSGHRIDNLACPGAVLVRVRVAAVAADRRADHAGAGRLPRWSARDIILAAAPVRNIALGSTPLAVYPEPARVAGGQAAGRGVRLGRRAPVHVVDRPAAEVERVCRDPATAGVRAPVVVPGRTGDPGQRLQRRRDRLGRVERARPATSATRCCRALARGVIRRRRRPSGVLRLPAGAVQRLMWIGPDRVAATIASCSAPSARCCCR